MTFQIRDLLLGVRDLLFPLGNLLFPLGNLAFAFVYFTPEILHLSLQPPILPLQLFPTGLVRVPMTIRRRLSSQGAASRSPIHPPYIKRFRSKCPAKSTQAPELLHPGFRS